MRRPEGQGLFRLATLSVTICAVTFIVAGEGRGKASPYSGPFTFTNDGANAVVTGCSRACSGGEIVVPTTDGNGHPVVAIDEHAFENLALTSVTIPNSVKSIGAYSFFGNSLSKLVLPTSVISIGSGAFERNLLTSMSIPNSVLTIDVYAFQQNLLRTVTVGSSVTTIEIDAFAKNPITTIHFLGSRPAAYGTLPSLECLSYVVGKTGWPGGSLYGTTPQPKGSCPQFAATTTTENQPDTPESPRNTLAVTGNCFDEFTAFAIFLMLTGTWMSYIRWYLIARRP